MIPAGVPTRHPVDIVAADVPRLLRALRESDRTVVLDCPPVTGMAETTILAAKADAVVLVVDARKFNLEILDQGLAQLRASGAQRGRDRVEPGTTTEDAAGVPRTTRRRGSSPIRKSP